MNRKWTRIIGLALSLALMMSLGGCLPSGDQAQQSGSTGGDSSTTAGGDTSSAIAAGSGQASKPLEGAEIVIRIGHPDAELDLITTPYYTYTTVFKQNLEALSNGRITCQVFPNSQLGGLVSMAEQVGTGDLEMTVGVNTGHLSSFAPAVDVIDIPFVFETTEIGRIVLDGEFGQALIEEVVDNSGIRILHFLPSAFRGLSNNKRPITSPEDMQGLKFRVMESPVYFSLMESLGATPVVISYDEIYTALQTGVADGQDNAVYSTLMVHLEEVQDYYTLSNHTLNCMVSIINDDFFQNLSAEDQKIVEMAGREAQLAFLGITSARTSNDTNELTAAGIEVTSLTSEQLQAFRDATQEPIMEILRQSGPEIQNWMDRMFAAIEDAERQVGLR